MNRFVKTAFLMILALASLAMVAQAPPSADAFVYSGTPTANYGRFPILAVQQGTNSYLQFNLATLPANSTVSKATLRLYIDAVAQAGSFDVYEMNDGGPRPAGAGYATAAWDLPRRVGTLPPSQVGATVSSFWWTSPAWYRTG